MDLQQRLQMISELEQQANITTDNQALGLLNAKIKIMKQQAFENLSAWDRVFLARHPNRSKFHDYLPLLFNDFIELHGDRCFGDDASMITGLAYFHDLPITIIAQAKGNDLSSNLKYNFGMNNPWGYRKAIRIAKQAEKFHRPIITFVDTPGAYPGKTAEENGQAMAIADCLATFSNLKVPVICVVLSEGGSGGALALSIADRIVMLENAVYSILSPEGFASILWKDESRYKEAAEAMKLTAYDLKELGIIDHIIKEPKGGVQQDLQSVVNRLDQYISQELNQLIKTRPTVLLNARYEKFRRIGTI